MSSRMGKCNCRRWVSVIVVAQIFDRHPEFREKGNRHFWAKGYYVNTVGRNEEEIKKYIKNQVEADQIEDNVKKQP